jgi:uncharacterized protein YndB with AHSA1/START domain
MTEGFDPRHGYNPDYVARSIRVEIEAPAELVWDVITDLPRYGEWNPFCVACESTLEVGAPVKMTMAMPWNPSDQPVMVEYVCEWDPPNRVAWKMDWSEAWPYAGRRDQVIETLGPERSAYYTTDAFLGDSAIHIMRFGHGWIKFGFDQTALALKARAEAIWAATRKSAA